MNQTIFTGLFSSARHGHGDEALRREQYFFTLYRVLVATVFSLLVFGPLPEGLVPLAHPRLAAAVAIAYLGVAVALLVVGRDEARPLRGQVVLGVTTDIIATVLMVHSVSQLQVGIAMALIVNFAAAAVLLPLHTSMTLAVAAGTALIVEYALVRAVDQLDHRGLIEILVCAAGYIAMTKLGELVGRQMRETHALAEQRGAEVASLAQVNELIIRRMRTGVLVVDVSGRVHLHNEAAWHLMGQPRLEEQVLSEASPELAQQLFRWRMGRLKREDEPMKFGADLPAVIPRFSGLGTSSELFVIFLEDASVLSRRAEEMTLSNLGRLSASIAHEIRNPLAAISYSAQLLEESEELPEADRRLVEIVLNHCQRMNGIIENVLSLSRRERSRPESIDIVHWATRFVATHGNDHHVESASLQAVATTPGLRAMVDPRQLDQVVSCLVQNAVLHGHMPGRPAEIRVIARRLSAEGPNVIEVVDRGPGIPPKVAETIFEPFVTTHEHGNGLGLYIAAQLCEANQASLEYIPAVSGSCFRVTLASDQRLENLPGFR